MNPEDQRHLVERFLSSYNGFDIDAMMATVHPEIEFVNVSEGEINALARGAEAFRALAEQSADLFSSRRQTVIDFEPGEEGAVVEVSWEGVLAVDLPNVGVRGDRLRFRGSSEFAFRDGLIHRLVDRS